MLLFLVSFVCVIPVAVCGRVSICHDKNWMDATNYDVRAERVYYIGCIEEEWDYAPSGKNLISGEKIGEFMKSGENTWLYGNGEDRIGRKYIKSRYVEFEDECFTNRKEINYEYEHLGIIGPAIRAITGEKIKIFYRNFCSFPSSMHPHGLLYDKTSEGSPYDDNSQYGDRIEPDGGWIYIWKARRTNVDENISSQLWLYHSHVDEVKDVISGLIGPIIITKRHYETSFHDLMPYDISTEFITFMVMFDENESFLVDKNMRKYLNVNEPGTHALKNDTGFQESNKMHSINGYLYGNLEGLRCNVGEGEFVRWYIASFGNEKDGPHSPHFHGNIVKTSDNKNVDTLTLIPGTSETVTMAVDATGKWLYHCHVFDHIVAGMSTTYIVES